MRLARLCSPACALGVLLLACHEQTSSMSSEGDAVAGRDVEPAPPTPVDDRDPPSTDIGAEVADPTAIASAGSDGGPTGVEGGAPDTGGDGGDAGDASKPTITCPASSYEMTLTRSLSVVASYAMNPLPRGVVNTTGTLRLWRPNGAVYPNVYYFNLKIPGESGSNFTLVSWGTATISGTRMSFSFGGSAGASDASTFPFTGCYGGARDRNKGTISFDNKSGTVSLSVSCSHWLQAGPLLKDQQIENTVWSGKGVAACVAPP